MTRPLVDSTVLGPIFNKSTSKTGVVSYFNVGTVESYRRQWSGTITPGFPKVKRINPYSVAVLTTAIGSGWYSYYVGGVFQSKTEGPALPAVIADFNVYGDVPPSGLHTHLEGLAAQDAVLKLKDMKVNLAQNLGEAKQTIGLVADTIRRFATARRALRTGDFSDVVGALGMHVGRSHTLVPKYSTSEKTLRFSQMTSWINGAKRGRYTLNKAYLLKKKREHDRAVKAGSEKFQQFLASSWLELQYGWKPLLGDIHELLEHFVDVPRDPLVHVEGYAKASGTETKVIQSAGYTLTRETLYKSTVKCRIAARLTGQTPASLSKWGISDPLLLAWELTPYSFVVDWFLPVGDFLESLGATSGYEFAAGYYSEKGVCNLNVSCSPKSPRGGFNGYTASGSYQKTAYNFNRKVLTGFPPIKLPSFKNPLSLTHFANALSLLKTASSGRVK